MTARFTLFRIALAGFASLAVSSVGLAETRLMSDPNGGVDPTATIDGPAPEVDATAGAVATASVPTLVDRVLNAPAAGGDPPDAAKVEIDPVAPQTLSGWRQFLAGIVASTGR